MNRFQVADETNTNIKVWFGLYTCWLRCYTWDYDCKKERRIVSWALIIFKGGGWCQNSRTQLYILFMIEIVLPRDTISCAVRWTQNIFAKKDSIPWKKLCCAMRFVAESSKLLYFNQIRGKWIELQVIKCINKGCIQVSFSDWLTFQFNDKGKQVRNHYIPPLNPMKIHNHILLDIETEVCDVI